MLRTGTQQNRSRHTAWTARIWCGGLILHPLFHTMVMAGFGRGVLSHSDSIGCMVPLVIVIKRGCYLGASVLMA